MKKIVIFLAVLLSTAAFSQSRMKDYSKIMQSKDIYELDAFLKDAHPDDPKRSVLKPRLMNLIKDYIKNAHPADPRVKEMQQKLALLQSRPSTKIGFDEMNAMIKERIIKKYQDELKRINQIESNTAENTATTETPDVSTTSTGINSSTTPAKSTSNTTTSVVKNNTSNTNSAPSTKNTTVKNSGSKVTTTTIANNSSNSSISTAKPTYSSTSNSTSGLSKSEEEEYKSLMNVTGKEHKENTVKILNSLFDNDPNSKESIVMIENKSNCNIIVRIDGTGNTKYRLAVPAHGDNSIVVKKGQYLFQSVVCGAQYASQKTVNKAVMVSLSTPR